jgi:Fe-S-cluster containining protein
MMSDIQADADDYFEGSKDRLGELISDAEGALDVTRLVLEHVTSNVEHATRRHDGEIACRKGCGRCCHQLVVLRWGEQLAIQKAVKALKPDDRMRVRAQAFVHFQIITDTQKQAPDGLGLNQMVRRMAEAIHQSGEPCPMLNVETDECRIYESRPSPCRAAFSFEVERCEDHFGYRGKPPVDSTEECGVEVRSDHLIPSDGRAYPLCVVALKDNGPF